MKALVCHRFGGPSVLSLEERPSAPLPVGHVRIAVEYAGIGFQDLLMVAGAYQLKPDFPFSPGNDVCGTVVECADGVSSLTLGQRVIAILPYGGYADEVVAPADAAIALPDSVDSAAGAALGIPYGTAHQALIERARTKEGEVVLIRGAGGGVGLAAVEIARHLGAVVVAAASTAEKRAAAEEVGADYLIDTSKEDLRERIMAITDGRGADVILDPVGAPFKDACLRCIAREGRILIVGFAGGEIPQIPAHYILNKYCAVLGVAWGRSYLDAAPERFRSILSDIVRLSAEGVLHPKIGVIAQPGEAAHVLEEIPERRISGRAVIRFGS